ncbi:hypothetical protein [Caballeronia hypogeia]|nr:hypothetical protein [Caballeronia hypogeia]
MGKIDRVMPAAERVAELASGLEQESEIAGAAREKLQLRYA